jgi:hypothetical protein
MTSLSTRSAWSLTSLIHNHRSRTIRTKADRKMAQPPNSCTTVAATRDYPRFNQVAVSEIIMQSNHNNTKIGRHSRHKMRRSETQTKKMHTTCHVPKLWIKPNTIVLRPPTANRWTTQSWPRHRYIRGIRVGSPIWMQVSLPSRNNLLAGVPTTEPVVNSSHKIKRTRSIMWRRQTTIRGGSWRTLANRFTFQWVLTRLKRFQLLRRAQAEWTFISSWCTRYLIKASSHWSWITSKARWPPPTSH